MLFIFSHLFQFPGMKMVAADLITLSMESQEDVIRMENIHAALSGVGVASQAITVYAASALTTQ